MPYPYQQQQSVASLLGEIESLKAQLAAAQSEIWTSRQRQAASEVELADARRQLEEMTALKARNVELEGYFGTGTSEPDIKLRQFLVYVPDGSHHASFEDARLYKTKRR